MHSRRVHSLGNSALMGVSKMTEKTISITLHPDNIYELKRDGVTLDWRQGIYTIRRKNKDGSERSREVKCGLREVLEFRDKQSHNSYLWRIDMQGEKHMVLRPMQGVKNWKLVGAADPTSDHRKRRKRGPGRRSGRPKVRQA